MEIERADVGSKRCKVSKVKFMNLEFFKRLRDEIEDGRIPDWLLVEVLTKLPAKFVLGSKLVSKQWLSLISEPYFRRTYIARALLLSQQPWTFISHIMHHKGSHSSHFPEYVLLKDISSHVLEPSYCVLPLPSTQPFPGGEYKYVVSGMSCGLVLYCQSHVHSRICSYYICSPVTGQWIALPPYTYHFIMESSGFLAHVEDGVLKSYTVVRLGRLRGRDNLLMFEVFFSEIGEWKNYTMSTEISFIVNEKEAIALNGVLHWMAYGQGIIAYDPHRNPEGIRVIALPSDVIHCHKDPPHIGLFVAYQGKLMYFGMSGKFISEDLFPSFQLWVLNDYGGEYWCLMHDISYKDVQHDTSLTLNFRVSSLAPISFHPFDSDLVYLGYSDLLLTYNIKTGKLEVQRKCSTGRRISRGKKAKWMRAFFLAIPPWPISIPHSFFAGAAEG